MLVDLRGHGHSSGEWLTNGPQEAKDMAQALDELDRRSLFESKVGVYGILHGATTAIHRARIDPRVEAVVDVAPFDAMRNEVSHYMRTMLPGIEKMIPEKSMQQAIVAAGERGGFNLNASDSRTAIQQTAAPVLILHGTNDWLVPPEKCPAT